VLQGRDGAEQTEKASWWHDVACNLATRSWKHAQEEYYDNPG